MHAPCQVAEQKVKLANFLFPMRSALERESPSAVNFEGIARVNVMLTLLPRCALVLYLLKTDNLYYIPYRFGNVNAYVIYVINFHSLQNTRCFRFVNHYHFG